MLLEHGQLDVGLLSEGPSLGVLEEEVEQVRAVQVGPLVHRLRDHVNVRQALKCKLFSTSKGKYFFKDVLKYYRRYRIL